ncbi:ribosome maturation factor RimP [Hymenobacter latericus]|uniref:ribosome maturation factor RimP n=1 Tax=Hymenobacter sp. YIM 151858-1 TaxID=2987688 RepID=UPI002227EDB4|nr:ribosome maturation factor [Hymenobacter sp. YIM 151858-1]UYZ57785.1 ribosome maturation factor [Hymenobacter sp. YIM 151858-1]
MSFERTRIQQMLEASLPGPEYFVVGLTVSDTAVRPKITATIDGDQGIGIDELGSITRRLTRQIDEAYGEDAAYSLEVTSPGADQPLVSPRQYARHTGRTLSLKMTDGTEKTGTLEEATAEGVVVSEVVKEKNKKKTLEPALVPFADIQEAKVVISFK